MVSLHLYCMARSHESGREGPLHPDVGLHYQTHLLLSAFDFVSTPPKHSYFPIRVLCCTGGAYVFPNPLWLLQAGTAAQMVASQHLAGNRANEWSVINGEDSKSKTNDTDKGVQRTRTYIKSPSNPT